MEMETSQRQRGVVGATCDARAAEKHPPKNIRRKAKALKCASFAKLDALKFYLGAFGLNRHWGRGSLLQL